MASVSHSFTGITPNQTRQGTSSRYCPLLERPSAEVRAGGDLYLVGRGWGGVGWGGGGDRQGCSEKHRSQKMNIA